MKNKNFASLIAQTFVKIGLALIGIGLLVAVWFGVDLPDWLEDLWGSEPPVISEPAERAPAEPAPAGSLPAEIPAGAVPATLIRTVDGDTAEVLVQGQTATIRYVGVDTPERGEPGYEAAQRANRRLLGNGDLYLVPDRSDRDRYGRLLRFIYTAEGAFVNRQLIEQGYAQPLEYRPDVTRAEEFVQAAREAATARRGFWSGAAEPDGAMAYALTQEEASLHEAPGTDRPIQAQVPAATPMTVYGRDRAGRWLQVRLPDRSGGWLQTSKVFLNVPLDQIGVTAESGSVEPVPTPAPTSPPPPAVSSGDIDGIVLRVVENAGSNEILALENTGRQTVSIGGWQLSGSIGDQVCTIPEDIELAAAQRYEVVSGRSTVTGMGFKCSGAFLWNNTGETIYLRAPDGRQIDVDSAMHASE